MRRASAPPLCARAQAHGGSRCGALDEDRGREPQDLSGAPVLVHPDACDFEVEVEGVPGGAAASWGLDALGAARALADGPCEWRYVACDPAVARDVAAGGVSPAWLFDTRGGALDAANPTIHLRLAVGNPCRILVSVQGARSPSANGTQILDVRPDRAGAVRLVRRWDELPKFESEQRGEEVAQPPRNGPYPRK